MAFDQHWMDKKKMLRRKTFFWSLHLHWRKSKFFKLSKTFISLNMGGRGNFSSTINPPASRAPSSPHMKSSFVFATTLHLFVFLSSATLLVTNLHCVSMYMSASNFFFHSCKIINYICIDYSSNITLIYLSAIFINK